MAGVVASIVLYYICLILASKKEERKKEKALLSCWKKLKRSKLQVRVEGKKGNRLDLCTSKPSKFQGCHPGPGTTSTVLLVFPQF